MENQARELAELLFPNINKTTDEYEAMYPPRDLPEGAKVTRMAPSPTGFVHFGSLFPTLVDERLAHQSGGVCYLRIEDTDDKREVKGAEQDIISSYRYFHIEFDESLVKEGKYGPYRQSDRREIYQTYAKKLVAEGKAYPCFCTAEELDSIRKGQEERKELPGYYGKYAHCRDLNLEQVRENLQAGKPFVIRYRCNGNAENKVKFTDLIKGNLELTENSIDHIILKSSGMPDYHFAHAVDDHLMHTTHVVRGEEWLPSLPYHIQLFQALGFRLPKYLHIAQLMRKEGEAKKKLSKRDKGASLNDYISEGYPADSVIEYVMTLLNSNYEDWRRANPGESYTAFPFAINKMSSSGSLFDMDKFNDVSKDVISRMSAETAFQLLSAWAEQFSPDFNALLQRDTAYTLRMLALGRGGKKPRKDLAKWSEAAEFYSFFFPETFRVSDTLDGFDNADICKALKAFAKTFDAADDQNVWFDKIKTITEQIGYCPNMKEFKEHPENWKGNIADVSSFIRVAVTGKLNSPDLYVVMQILGGKTVLERIEKFVGEVR